jgi:hypothetical protein
LEAGPTEYAPQSEQKYIIIGVLGDTLLLQFVAEVAKAAHQMRIPDFHFIRANSHLKTEPLLFLTVYFDPLSHILSIDIFSSDQA